MGLSVQLLPWHPTRLLDPVTLSRNTLRKIQKRIFMIFAHMHIIMPFKIPQLHCTVSLSWRAVFEMDLLSVLFSLEDDSSLQFRRKNQRPDRLFVFSKNAKGRKVPKTSKLFPSSPARQCSRVTWSSRCT